MTITTTTTTHAGQQRRMRSTLATVSKDITRVLNTILYHTVTLETARRATLFARAAHVNPSLLAHVRHLNIMATNLKSHTWADVWGILPQCKGLLSVTLSDGDQVPALTTCLAAKRPDILSSVTVRQFSDIPLSAQPSAATSLARLRVCEPSDMWHAPSDILTSFGGPHLSHLQLARRVNGNEENDEIFAEEVKQILLDQPRLKTLVVSLFPSSWAVDGDDADIEQSHIWQMLHGADERLLVVKGKYGRWVSSPWGTAICT
ncbi:hypothetical protein BDZ89DRAFT_1064111 [Hymenopellis radicata]|nr:hypothetical protein BDZ89DRAFT_1064111 [Hymenopellis radicata]